MKKETKLVQLKRRAKCKGRVPSEAYRKKAGANAFTIAIVYDHTDTI